MKADWLNYYKTAYERQKKANTILSSKVSGANARRESLQENLARIENNTCYKMTLPVRKVKNIGNHLKPKITTEVCGAADSLYHSYQEQLEGQRDPYSRWIQEYEAGLWLSKLNQTPENKAEEETAKDTEYILFCKKPACMDKKAEKVLRYYFRMHPQAVLVYGQEDQIDADGRRGNPWFKPEWSANTLLSFFYLGSFFAVRKSFVQDEKQARALQRAWESDRGNGLLPMYDYVLEMTEKLEPEQIGLLDLVLYHDRVEQLQEIEDYLESERYQGYQKTYVPLKQQALKRRGFSSTAYQTWQPSTWTVVPMLSPQPKVSVIIPTKDHPEVLETCLTSFVEKTDYQNLQFIIVDNGSEPENRQRIEQYLEGLKVKTGYEFTYLYQPMEFNFSLMCNLGEQKADGELILLLNNDIEIIEENWLKIMAGQAMLPGTGAVGAKLWYPQEQRIQHTGITNMHIGPSHKLVTYVDDKTYYYGHNTLPYDMIGVTAACLLVKKSIYEEVRGMDEEMKVSYNDVDFCFKIYEQGYTNVIRNDAVLVHHESLTRGLDAMSEEKWERLLREKTGLYRKHPELKGYDPYYSEYLADNDPAYKMGYQYPYERLLLTMPPEKLSGKEQLHQNTQNALMLTMERVMKQHKIHLEEPDIYMAEGWCYMLGADNCRYERWLVLENVQENWYYRIPVLNRYRADVEAILPQQIHIGMSGFVCRMLKQDLTPGTYNAGILYQDCITGKNYYTGSDKTVTVTK